MSWPTLIFKARPVKSSPRSNPRSRSVLHTIATVRLIEEFLFIEQAKCVISIRITSLQLEAITIGHLSSLWFLALHIQHLALLINDLDATLLQLCHGILLLLRLLAEL